MCLQNRGKNFEVEKKSVGVPRSSAFSGLARLYRLAADGPRISHSEPSSNVGSPESVTMLHSILPYINPNTGGSGEVPPTSHQQNSYDSNFDQGGLESNIEVTL